MVLRDGTLARLKDLVVLEHDVVGRQSAVF
ncbi:MAG: hypothetical protein RL552_210, partial [Actinomycetota bacterium]